MVSFGATDIGKVRTSNQDAFICGTLSENAVFAVVCDGMGGASGGNVASSIAVRTISKRIVESYRKDMTIASMQNVLESAIATANIEVYDEAAARPELHGMGTTLVLAVVIDRNVLVAHIGDSRAYVLVDHEDGKLEQITKDHSVVQQLLERGTITPEEAKNHPRRNLITRALGVGDRVACDFAEFELPECASILLCTDGLSGMIEASRMATIARQCDKMSLPGKLIAAANEAGGNDNITVALITEDASPENKVEDKGVVCNG